MNLISNITITCDGAIVVDYPITLPPPNATATGIEKFITKVCVQPAVYWGSPKANGTGGYTYAPARLIYVRWDDKIQSVSINRGKEVTSIAELIVTEDLALQGMLLLNHTLAEVTGLNPLNIPDAVEIIKIEKVPMIKSNSVFVRKVYVK